MNDAALSIDQWCKNPQIMEKPWFSILDETRKQWDLNKTRQYISTHPIKKLEGKIRSEVGYIIKSSVHGMIGVIIYEDLEASFFRWWVAWDNGSIDGSYQSTCFE